MNFSVHFSVHLKNISKDNKSKSDPNHNLEVFLQGNVLKIINFLEKSLEFLYFQKMAMIPAFFDRNMPRNFGFYDRKMN